MNVKIFFTPKIRAEKMRTNSHERGILLIIADRSSAIQVAHKKRVKICPKKKKHTKHINMQRSQHFTGIYRIYFSLFSLDLLDHHIILLAQKSQKRAPKQSRKANIKCFGKIFFSSLLLLLLRPIIISISISLALFGGGTLMCCMLNQYGYSTKEFKQQLCRRGKKYRASKSKKTKAFKNEFFMPSLGLRSGRRHSYNIYVQRLSRLHTLALWNWISKRFRSSDVGAVIIYIHHRIRFYCGDNNLKLNVELRREREGTVRTK